MNNNEEVYTKNTIDNTDLGKKALEILNKNLHEQKAMNWVLGEVIKVSSNLNSFVGLMEIITDMLMGVMGLDTCTIWIRNKKSFKCYYRSIYNENIFVEEESNDLPEYFMRIKKANLFNLNNDEYRFVKGKNVESILLVPLDDFKNKSRIGVIVAEHHSKEYFTKNKTDFFYTLAIQISIASENAKLFEEERKKSEDEIRKRNELIIENVNYASVIQNSLLPDISFMKEYADDAFVIWKPRDIVGGDIYWFIPQKNGFCAAIIDCTGHGVSGAFVTIAVNQMLNQILKESETQSASDILNKLNSIFKDTFYKFNKGEHFHAGLDIGICIVNKESKKLMYSGAHISLFHYSQGELREIRGINRSIGYGMEIKRKKKIKEFTDTIIDYLPGDIFYMSTDGIIDQNGNENIYPLGVDNFMTILKNVGSLAFDTQKDKIWNSVTEYMGDEEQRDDITLISIKPE